MNSRPLSIASVLTLSLLAFAGVWLLLYSTPQGLGLNDDSVAYIAGARSIMSGQGFRASWLVSNEPMSHFPPGFPAVLALIGWVTGLDPVRGARGLNGLLFGLNIALTGWLAWRMTKSRAAGIFSAALFLLSGSFLHIHSRAMSEPLYIFLTLVAFLLLDWYFERPGSWKLLALGCVLGWAYLSRYAALFLLATLAVALFLSTPSWRKRIASIAWMLAGALPWIVGWSIRNRIAAGSYTNRGLGWHPVNAENWNLAVKTFGEFIIPITAWWKAVLKVPGLMEGILIAIGLVLLAWVSVHALRRIFWSRQGQAAGLMPLANGLYILAYLLGLVTTMTLFDPATKFQVRILSPVYPSLLLLLACFGAWLWQRGQAIWKFIVALAALGLLVMMSIGQVEIVDSLRPYGQVFAGPRWYDSEAIAYLDSLPENTLIFTNQCGVVYLYTDRPCTVLPGGDNFEPIHRLISDGKAAIAVFRPFVNETNIDYYNAMTEGLYEHRFGGDRVFTAPPQ